MSTETNKEYGVMVTAETPKDKSHFFWEPVSYHVRVRALTADDAKQMAEKQLGTRFGNVRTASRNIKAHYSYGMDVPVSVLTPEEATANGFPVYNGNAHVCLETQAGQGLTVSIKLPDGKSLTVAVVHAGHQPDGTPRPYAECVDIQLHGTGKTWNNNGTLIPEFQTFQFRRGKLVADTRGEGMAPATTVVVLANPEYYKK